MAVTAAIDRDMTISEYFGHSGQQLMGKQKHITYNELTIVLVTFVYIVVLSHDRGMNDRKL